MNSNKKITLKFQTTTKEWKKKNSYNYKRTLDIIYQIFRNINEQNNKLIVRVSGIDDGQEISIMPTYKPLMSAEIAVNTIVSDITNTIKDHKEKSITLSYTIPYVYHEDSFTLPYSEIYDRLIPIIQDRNKLTIKDDVNEYRFTNYAIITVRMTL